MSHLSPEFEQLLATAERLASEDRKMRYELVQARRNAGLSQKRVAELLGVKQASVAAFERYDNDPKLSTIRRYALAVGAEISHTVTTREDLDGWDRVATVQSSAVSSRARAGTVRVPAPASSGRTPFGRSKDRW